MMRGALLAAGLIGLAGCGAEPVHEPAPRTVVAQAPPADGLWLGLDAVTEHVSPAGHGAPLAWVPISWAVDDGAAVEEGGELLRYDASILEEWNERDGYDIQRDDQRKRLELLRGEGDIERLHSRIRQLRSQRAVVAAELEAASRTDPDEIRIAQLQLDDARAEHAAAVRRRERLERIAAAGAPVAGADLARAREEEVRTRAAIAAPEVALELARLPAARSTVQRLRLSLADMDAQLGASADQGLESELRTARERQARRELERGRGRSEWRRRQYEERVQVLRDPVVRARIGGTAVLRSPDVRPGMKLPKDASSVFVLGEGGLSARLGVPERLRTLISTGSRVALRSPAFPRPVLGEVRTIGAAPQRGNDGAMTFPADIALAAPPPGMRPGMSAACDVAVDASGAAAIVPGFCLDDASGPAVIMGDGSMRRLVGFPVGAWFVAVAGLAPGEPVRVPLGRPSSTQPRATALVEPANYTPVRLRSWNWEYLEILPEGTQVAVGDRIARLVKVDHWRSADQLRADADLAAKQAQLDLVIAQLSAADERAAAIAAWSRARIARDRTRLEAWVARNAYDAVAQARTAAALSAAEVARERAVRELVAAEEEHAAGGISDNRLRERRIAVDRTVATLDRARLDAAVDSLGPDWLELRRLDDAARSSAETEMAEQTRDAIAGESFRSRLASATERFNSTRRWVENDLRNLADEEVLSPAAGVLVWNRVDGDVPRPGEPVRSWEPFRIADGGSRRAIFEVPARLHGRIAVGQHVVLSVPGGTERIQAEVVAVASAFLQPSGFADEIALGRTIGPEESVFTVTVAFTPPAGILPPGSTVALEL